MRTFILTALMCLGFALHTFAQNLSSAVSSGRTCATDAYTALLQAEDPELKERQQVLKQKIQQSLTQQGVGQKRSTDVVVTVPVVFHVLYNAEEENVSEAALLSQLAVLNEDFRRMNADTASTPEHFRPYAADTRIEFCLASIDPNGNLTNGITRTRTTNSSFSYVSDNVKYAAKGGTDIWDRDQYLNIWICNLGGDIQSNILGYATPPGSRAVNDGVVLHYASVGAPPANDFKWNYNQGRTATHEVGHWLGLGHIWGSGSSCTDSDGIDDTPNQREENGGCHTGIKNSCDDSPFGDMYQNYMDYSDDACMNLFTKGQADFMQAILATSRSSILNSLACTRTLRSDFETTSPNDTLVIAGNTVLFSDASAGLRPEAWYWEFEGGVPAVSTQQNPSVTYPRPGRYGAKLTITNGDLSSTEVKEKLVHVTVSDLVVYPNPTTDFLTIEQPARILVRQVELVNKLGQVIINEQISSRVLRLDVRDLPQGLYILRIKSSNGTEVKRISVLR
ncbi:T9SS C-terminal target domain-containing protein [Pontibacter diazotrophicus]|uniref:T9SS C-terminal target domain-containing protein n=1 Tax=Pontibacter diazotrophicus TaxID=1400979 RepID=A0A3D8LAK8_9BACT|nr:M43 family zinc metalloprotease [Pontibacter diazotrophicus]RDV14445.1 T9SS C-terminal target domain-containing protein [Pontibacter diazotrophicus]